MVSMRGISLLSGVVFLGLSLPGCVLGPTDGDRVGSRDSSIGISGVETVEGFEVDVEAFNVNTERFEAVARARSERDVSAFIGSFFGGSWYAWSYRLVLPDEYWSPGDRGFSTQLRVRSVADRRIAPFSAPLRERWGRCLADNRNEDILTVAGRCRTPGDTITLCTDNYFVGGIRRGPCPPRELEAIGTAASVTRGQGLLRLEERTSTFVQGEQFNSIRLRGDGASFVDVFDRSLATETDRDILDSRGPLFSSFVRIYYPESRDSTERTTVNLEEVLSDMPLPRGLEWEGARSVRFYDTGACSLVLTWREIMDLLYDAMPDFLNDARDTIREEFGLNNVRLVIRPDSRRTVLNPILRTGKSDAINLFQVLDVDVRGDLVGGGVRLGGLDATLDITAAIRADARGLVVDVENLNVTLDRLEGFWLRVFRRVFGLDDLDGRAEEVRADIAAQLNTSITNALGMLNNLIRVRRVHARPEGFEFVLAETQDDPQFATVQTFGPLVFPGQNLCNRPDGSPAQQFATGLYTSVFEPPLRSDPPVFGNEIE